ncbi:phospholipase A2 inhibitor and Ly6/PLAUR domain-containing protein-like [Dicentrarchus labrax]|uniref:phospholipase A2 inhibitor and Ly6/PLAUR domain-containing protein-like n=1 Tax=Dicentrarchus labrax TaxID=13489 RepID=UPI0021F65990|nr:phospholipase A2 inhibitor and Ly6/PLAUR domain-containing protein-like [Dicentrarchus labrax]
MMKLIPSLTLIWALSSTAGALQCQTCTNLQCSSTVLFTCLSATELCLEASIQGTSSGATVQQILKACAPPSLCPATGFQNISVNLGIVSAVASVRCCNTDNCNNNTTPASPVAQTSNSLQCFTCNTSQCNIPLQCKGEEDRCFQASVINGSSTFPVFGCASSNLCTAAASLGSLPFVQGIGDLSSSGPSCCNTSLCNTVTTTTTSDACRVRLATILLMLGLLILTLC